MPGRLFYGFDAEKLVDPQPPIAGESLLSWVARNSVENVLPNITVILRDVGQCHRNKMTDIMRKAIDVEGLGIILGSNEATVQAMRADDADDGRIRYLGALIRHGDLHTASRRFAPTALRSDKIPFYRASWLVRTFPVCTEHWEVLRSSCDCDATQTWATVNTMDFCETCDGDLRELGAEKVPADAQPGLAFLADILFGDLDQRDKAMSRLPPVLQQLDPGDVYELAPLMARIVDPTMGNPREAVWREEPLRLARALAKAGPLLREWPATPWLALAVSGNPMKMNPRSPPLVALHRILSRDWATSVSSQVACLLDDICNGITLDDDDGSHPLVDLNDAARILGMDKKDIRSARAAGYLGSLFVIRRCEILPGYERSKLEEIAEINNWPAASTTAKHLGMPPYGLEQLCAMDEVMWAKPTHRALKTGFYIDPRSADELQRLLRSLARPIIEIRDPVSLTTAMRGIGGREKPWGPVIRALLEGVWPYAIGRQGNVVREIFVDRGNVDAIRSMAFDPSQWSLFEFSRDLNQADATDVLNVPLRNRASIERYKTCKRNTAWVFDRATVGMLASRVVTSSELRARHDLEVKTSMARIKRAKIKPLDFGYARNDAINRFDAADIQARGRPPVK